MTLISSYACAQQAQPAKDAGPAPAPRGNPADTEVWEPVPAVVVPGVSYGAPPSDAIILFREIHRSIPKITTRVLSKELKDLEANKLIVRTVYDSSPVSVEYTIAPYSHTLKPVVDEMVKWGENHKEKVTGK